MINYHYANITITIIVIVIIIIKQLILICFRDASAPA